MILLDTNVVSETMRPNPDEKVLAWLDSQGFESLYLCTITVAELRSGVLLMPVGKRQQMLHALLEHKVLPVFAGRILPFDMSCTAAYASVLSTSRRQGHVLQVADACIAAVAMAHGFIVASRDDAPFLAAGLTVINPWE